MPEIDPNVPTVNIGDLEHQSREELIELGGTEYGLDDAAALPHTELIFRILQAQAGRNGTIFFGRCP